MSLLRYCRNPITAKALRLRDEHDFSGGYAIVSSRSPETARRRPGTVTTDTQGPMLGELPVVVRFSEPSTGFARSNLTIVKGYATGMASLG